MENKLKVLELFSGIRACSKALERLGIDYECVDSVEIDKYAVKSQNAIYGTNFEPQDITTWDKDLEVDLIMHGSPCQDFSIAGKGNGGDEGSGTRSSLLYETVRIVAKLKPKYVIWENVKAVLNKNHKHNFDNYLEKMEELGYTNYYQVLNAKDYGIPQNRERVFTVSILNQFDTDGVEILNCFTFPPKQELKLRLKDMLEDEVDEKYYLSEAMKKYIVNTNESETRRGRVQNQMSNTITTSDNLGVLETNKIIREKPLERKGWHNKAKEIINPKGISTCISTQSNNLLQKIKQENYRIRKLTPLECWRLMGFDDEDYYKAEKVNSNSQLYKQAGNSIVVNVLEAILKELLLSDTSR